jgi:hypothetical protein
MLKQAVKTNPPIFPLAVLFIALVALFAMSDTVRAGQSVCRADPIVYFTDGTQVTMTTDLSVAVDQIHQLNYTVRTPRGKTVSRIAYDVGGLGVKEIVTVTVDPNSTSFTVDQYAITVGAAQVTATNTVNTKTKSVRGHNNQHLSVSITP